jgi:hypothetical protein
MNVGQSARAERGWERSKAIARLKHREKTVAFFKVLPFCSAFRFC